MTKFEELQMREDHITELFNQGLVTEDEVIAAREEKHLYEATHYVDGTPIIRSVK